MKKTTPMKRTFIILTLIILTMDSIAQNAFIKHYGEFSGLGNSLIINSNGNYIIAGSDYVYSKNLNFFIYELNKSGDILGFKEYGTDSVEEANQIIQTIDGGYATVGYSMSLHGEYRSIFFVKTNSTGIVSWTKHIGGLGRETGTSIVQTISGEYFIGGTSKYKSKGLFDFYLVKTDINGDTLWTKKYGGIKNEEASSMHQTSDGGFILSGYSESFSFGLKDFYLVKTNSIGDTLWTSHYGGKLDEFSNSVRQTSDGGYIMTGISASFGLSTENMYVVKTNSIGDTLWTKTYGQVGKFSVGGDIIQTKDGGYAAIGKIEIANTHKAERSDLYLIKIDEYGNVQWEKEFIIEPTKDALTRARGLSILQTSDGGFAVSGVWFNGSTTELLFIKTDNNGTVGINELQTNSNFTVSPNPFNQSATLQFENSQNEKCTLTLLDSEGRIVRTILNIKSDKIKIERNNLKSGLYFYQLRTDAELRATGKFIIE